MNFDNNAAVMKDASLSVSGDMKESMQSLPPTSFSSPPGLPPPPQPPQQSVSSQASGTIHYGVETMFSWSSPTTATSSYFSQVNSINASPIVGSSLTSHQPPPHPHALPHQPASSVLSYRQPDIPSSSLHPVFTPPSSYPVYPSALPISTHPDQSRNERFLFPGGPHSMSRFPGFTGKGSNPTMPGYGGAPDNGGLRSPYSSSLLPSERKVAGVSSTGCARNSSDGEAREAQSSRKKRKACGHCPPCQRKENCGTCQNCINRTKGKQICIHRKCDVLKKKPGSTTYLTSASESKLEKRKDIDDFLPSNAKRSRSSDNPATDLPQGLIHPTLHPNFPEFGDVRQTSLQDLPNNRQLSFSHVTSSNKQSANENLPFFNPNEEHHRYDLSGGGGGESDFISQALQAIEGNISTNPSQPKEDPVHNDSASAGLNSSPQLLIPHHRRDSQTEATFCWNSQSVAPIKLPGQPPPGPGPGSDDQSLTGPAQLHDLQKFGSSPSFQTDLQPLKESLKPASSVPARRQSTHDPGLNLETSRSHAMPNQQSRSNFQTTSHSPQEGQSGQQPLLHQRGHAYPQYSGSAFMANQLGANIGHSGIVQPHGQVGQPAPTSFPGANQQFPYNDPSNFLNKPLVPSNNRVPAVPPTQQPPGHLPIGTLTRPLLNPAQYPNSMQYNQNGALSGQATVGYVPNNPQFGSTINHTFDQSKPLLVESPSVVNRGNGQQWTYDNQPHGIHNMGVDSIAVPGPIDSPTGGVFQSSMPRPSSFPNRRISNTSVEGFHNQRHLSAGSCGNNRSPMMQSSPASGPSVLNHSPFASGNSVKSPLSSLVSGSPAPQVQGVVSSPMPQVSPYSMHNTTAMVSLTTLPASVESSHQRNMQSYHSGHDQQDPNPATSPGIHYHARLAHSVAPSDGYAQKPAVPVNPATANHFLAKPGSSFGIPETQKPYNGSVASPSGDRDRHGADTSVPTARLLCPTKDSTQAADIGLQTNTSAQRTFTETMKSVLYGHTPSDTPGPHFAESPTDAHSTISPAESGYDSMDHSSIPGDNVSQHNGNTATKRPKNWQAALMGSNKELSKTDCHQSSGINPLSLSGNAGLHCSTIKAAVPQVSGLNETNKTTRPTDLPHLNSALSDLNNNLYSSAAKARDATSLLRSAVTKPRSASFDAGSGLLDSESVEMDFLAPQKPKLSLRRFSCQGIGRAERISYGKTSFELPSKLTYPPTVGTSKPSLLLRNCELTTTRLSQSYVTQPLKETKKSQTSSESLLPKQDIGNQAPPGFDTPPQTPNILSADPIYRKCADPNPNGIAHGEPIQGPPQAEGVLTSDDLRGRTVNVKGSNGNTVKRTIFPQCDCLKGMISGDDAPYYTHLGCARDSKGVRKLFEKRIGFTGKALRIEKVCYTGKEGKTSYGCPVAKWILRRSSVEEKAMIVCRQRPGHRCASACVVLAIMLWDGVPTNVANFTYAKCTEIIPGNGIATERRCGTNEERTCACQGFDPDSGGASFSFGCSWSMYYNGCKFARSTNPNKFKLAGNKNQAAESFLDEFCQTLATLVSRLYKRAAPEAYKNQTEHEEDGTECRLGMKKDGESRPFSGVTCCMDFCAHSHKDQHNMDNGTTIVVTLTKPENRAVGVKPSDEQLHVLPLYRWDPCNEEGTLQGIGEKLKTGAVEILSGFRREVRLRDKPLGTCKQRKDKKRRDANFSISPAKKKGRKPKRSQSMEDLSMMGTLQNEGCPSTKSRGGIPHWDPSMRSTSHPASCNPLTSPPPRWPYRRHPSTSQDHDADHLPSIGSIFSPVSSTPGLTPPVTPNQTSHVPLFQFGRRLSTVSLAQQYLSQQDTYSHLASSTLGSRSCSDRENHQPTTPLPSLNTVMGHPFCKDFSSVKSEPNQDHCSSYPQNHGKINLKSYIAPQEVKCEPEVASHGCSLNPQAPLHPGSLESPEREVFSDSEECFRNPNVGGVAIATGHGSILIECAKRELHATTSLLKPNRFHPSRISLVFYQHKNMNFRNHGAGEYLVKEAKRTQEKAAKREREEIEKLEMMQQRELEARCNPHTGVTESLPNTPQAPCYLSTGFGFPKNPGIPLSHHRSGPLDTLDPHIPVFHPKRFPFAPPASSTWTSRCSLPNDRQLLQIPSSAAQAMSCAMQKKNEVEKPSNPATHTAPFQSSSVCQPYSRSDPWTPNVGSLSQCGSVLSPPTFQTHFHPNPVLSSGPSQSFSHFPVASTHGFYYSSEPHTAYPGTNSYHPTPLAPSLSPLGGQPNPRYLTSPMQTPAIVNYGVGMPGVMGASHATSAGPIYNPGYPISSLRYAL